MSNRITISDIEGMLGRLNRQAGTPMTPYSKDSGGKYRPNANNYHLSQAYGGCMVVKMSGDEGCTGISTPITQGHVSKRDCYDTLWAYIRGMEDAA